jgi:hypothetical protein
MKQSWVKAACFVARSTVLIRTCHQEEEVIIVAAKAVVSNFQLTLPINTHVLKVAVNLGE